MTKLVTKSVHCDMLGIIVQVVGVVVIFEWASVVLDCSHGGKLELEALFPSFRGFMIDGRASWT